MIHPLVQQATAETWGFDFMNWGVIMEPSFVWYGWNSNLEEYGTIIFTYPLAFITIFLLPIGYFFIISYHLIILNFS